MTSALDYAAELMRSCGIEKQVAGVSVDDQRALEAIIIFRDGTRRKICGLWTVGCVAG